MKCLAFVHRNVYAKSMSMVIRTHSLCGRQAHLTDSILPTSTLKMANHWLLNLKLPKPCWCGQLGQVPQPGLLHLHWLGHLPSLASHTYFACSQGFFEYYMNISKVNCRNEAAHLQSAGGSFYKVPGWSS